MSSRTQVRPEVAPKPSDLLVRQKCEAMIQYGYVALEASREIPDNGQEISDLYFP